MKIYRYKVHPVDAPVIKMPQGAKILHLGWQEGQGLQVWALVDPEATHVARHFRLYGTGQKVEERRDQLKYIGTTADGILVYHLFEVLGTASWR